MFDIRELASSIIRGRRSQGVGGGGGGGGWVGGFTFKPEQIFIN